VFRKLRLLVFGTAVAGLFVSVWLNMAPGGSLYNVLHSTTMDSTGRASALALCVLLGLVFSWVAANNVAKVLARNVGT
jgi:hypothetical protein